ncbi:MAG: EamA family transporter RarD [Gulosibacter sp.]|uniref:EamA family transporter RarD n=1 Tax=Gulosibacter sp. TaxID=2817531 RepID=UPI003F937CFF
MTTSTAIAPGSARSGVIASILASASFAALFGVPGMLTGLDPFATFAWRVLAALPFLVVILFALRQWPQMRLLMQRFRKHPGLIGILVLDSLLFGVQVFLFAWGPMTGSALAVSFGYFLLPLVLVALGVILFREKLGWMRSSAVALAVAGVVIALAAGASVSWETLAVALGYPAYFVLRRRFELDSPAALSLEIALLAPISLAFVLQPAAVDAVASNPGNWGGILALGFFTAFGFSAYTLAQRALPMSLFGLLGYLEPVLLVVVSVALLGEPLGMGDAFSYTAIGLAILLLMLDGLPKRARRSEFGSTRSQAIRTVRKGKLARKSKRAARQAAYRSPHV